METLIDLLLDGDFPREMVATRRQEIEQTISELIIEREKLSQQFSSEYLSDEQIVEITAFAESIKDGIRKADFETKRRIIDLLDVRGKLAIESGEKVVYVTCKLEQQPQSLVQTLPS